MLDSLLSVLSFIFQTILVIAVLALILFIIGKMSKKKKGLKKTEAEFGQGGVEGAGSHGLKTVAKKERGAGDAQEGEYDGIKFFYRHGRIQPRTPPSFRVWINASLPARCTVTKKSSFLWQWLSKTFVFKMVGLSAEVKTGDPTFDKEVCIYTDAPGFASQLFAHPDKREIIREIFFLGFNTVSFTEHAVEAEQQPARADEADDPERIKKTVKSLSRLV